jgi:tRNA 2-(methylsulfanyl)-N6-isopentenyladenosine37 hydroxylase
MLGLKSTTPVSWVREVEANLDDFLIDHAHCEKKAAGTAMNLIFAQVDNVELVVPLSTMAREELEHFEAVLEILKQRGIVFRRLQPSSYGKRLAECVRKQDPLRMVDRCLVAALIEARSCERFSVLRDHLNDKGLAEFYGSLFESEASHYATYIRFAQLFRPADEVKLRLEELSHQEAEIIERGDDFVRVHS